MEVMKIKENIVTISSVTIFEVPSQ